MSKNVTIPNNTAKRFATRSSGQLRMQVKLRSGVTGEGIATSLEGGAVELVADSEYDAGCVQEQIQLAAKAGFLGEWLGLFRPRYVFRPLWWMGGSALSEGVAQKLQRWGYNAVIVSAEARGISAMVKCKVDVYLHVTAGEPAGVSTLCEQQPECAGVLWESRWQSGVWSPDAEHTVYDQLLDECKSVEKAAGARQVIFYVPTPTHESREKFSLWFEDLCDRVGPKTLLAFDSDENHPVWDVLSRAQDCSATRLLPVCNAGQVGAGEGYWPVCNSALVEGIVGRMTRHTFAGLLTQCATLPAAGTLLEGSLWVAGQRQWHALACERLWHTWFAAHYEESATDWLPTLREVERLGREVVALRDEQSLKPDTRRLLAESLLAQLNLLAAQRVDSKRNHTEGNEVLSLGDQVHLFVRDAKKLVLQYLQKHNLTVANALTGDDMQESPWVEVEGAVQRGMRGGSAKVLLRDMPLKEGTDPRLAKLHRAVTGV